MFVHFHNKVITKMLGPAMQFNFKMTTKVQVLCNDD